MTDRLDALEASARAAWGATLHHGRLGCEHLLAGAAALAEARALCPSEAWGEWLKELSIPRAAAVRLLEIHRIALDARALDDLGGIVLATLWAAEARLPREGEALAVTLGDWQPDRSLPTAYVWRCPDAPGSYCAGLIDLAGPVDGSRVTRGPLAQERDLWATVWHLLDHRVAEMLFRPVRDPALVERLEARRQAVLKAGAPRVH